MEHNNNNNDVNQLQEGGGMHNSGPRDEVLVRTDDNQNYQDNDTDSSVLDHRRIATSAAEFEVGEKVLAYHQSLIYEAKVLKTDLQTSHHGNRLDSNDEDLVPMYYIHYQGWKDRWDEWVPSSRIMKCNDKNYQLQKQLKDSHKQQKQLLQQPQTSTANHNHNTIKDRSYAKVIRNCNVHLRDIH